MDVFSRATRRRVMQAVRQRDTHAETVVRKSLTKYGARYRVNVRRLTGTPDVANRKRRWAVL
jgi:DNA mismatch endonuclease (patch repair protein)